MNSSSWRQRSFWILTSLAIAACGKPELEPLQELNHEVYDPWVLPLYIEKLREARVLFRQEGNIVYYSKEDRERARKAFDAALAERPQHFGFTDQATRDRIVVLLRNAGLKANPANEGADLPYRIYVPRDQYETARGIVREGFLPQQKQ